MVMGRGIGEEGVDRLPLKCQESSSEAATST